MSIVSDGQIVQPELTTKKLAVQVIHRVQGVSIQADNLDLEIESSLVNNPLRLRG